MEKGKKEELWQVENKQQDVRLMLDLCYMLMDWILQLNGKRYPTGK